MRDVYVPDGSAMINAFHAGQSQRRDREAMEEEVRRREGRQRLGGLMASGDYAGAARAAFESGDLNAGLQLQGRVDEAATKTRRREIRQRFTTDPNGAIDAAMEEDEALYADLRKLSDEAEKQRYGQFAAVIRSIGSKEPDVWDDEIAANRPQLEGLGIPAAEIDSFIQASPQQRVGMMAMLLQRADQFDKFQEEREKDRAFKAAEAERATDNRRADEQLGISRAQLGVSRGNLGQRQAEHAARLAGKGGYSGGAGGYDDLPAGAQVVR